MSSKKGISILWLIVVIILAVIVIGWVLVMLPDNIEEREPQRTATTTDESPEAEPWVTYENTTYGFTLEHPPHWQVAESGSSFETLITFYPPPAPEGQIPPFTHFVNATHVSVYPQGIPTEGLFAPTQRATLDLTFPYEATGFMLESGEAFAWLIRPLNLPESWQQAGFVWGRVAIADLQVECLKNGTPTPQNECDPLGAMEQIEFTWSGEINPAESETVRRILSTLRLTGTTTQSTP